jgi:surfeit locus 1 family protein
LDQQSSSRRRRPRWLPLVAAVLGIALTASAGKWQLNRAGEKERLQAAYDRGATDPPISLSARRVTVDEVLQHRVEANGEFVPQAMVLLDNRIHAGMAGYHVLMPLRIAGSSMHVLVNRGWVAAGADRSRLPEIRTPPSTVAIAGVAVVPGRFLELAKTDSSGVVWQNLTIERYIEHKGLAMQPVVIEQTGDLDDGLVRSWPRPDFGIAKHYGYAVQWFSFCGLIVFLYGYFHVRSSGSKKNAANAASAGRH